MLGVESFPVLHVVTEEFDSNGTLVSANVSVFNTECDDDGDNTAMVYSGALFIPADDIALTDNRVVSTCVATDEDRVVITFDETDEDKVVVTCVATDKDKVVPTCEATDGDRAVPTCVATGGDKVMVTFGVTDEEKVVASCILILFFPTDGDDTIKDVVFGTALVVFNNGVVLITECDVDNGNVDVTFVIVGAIVTLKDWILSNCFVETIFVTVVDLVVDSVITSKQEPIFHRIL